MILHLLPEEKITSLIIDTFDEAFPGQNIYICFPEKNIFQGGYIDKIILSSDRLCDMINHTEISTIIIHYLDVRKVRWLNRQKFGNVRIFWIMWGGDLYNQLLSLYGLEITFGISIKNRFKRRLKHWLNLIPPDSKEILDYLKSNKVEMVASEEEYALAQKYIPNVFNKLSNSFWFYYPVEYMLGPNLANEMVNGNRIFIGNSASETNNHLYVFEYIKYLDFKGRKLTVPLNYGGTADYKRQIIECGSVMFSNYFEPLMEFLPLDQYHREMLQSEVFIYGNWRQEALGNILVALALGAKVFLSKKNPILSFLRNMRIEVCELETITQEAIDTPLSPISRKKNKMLILNNFSRNRQIRLAQSIFV